MEILIIVLLLVLIAEVTYIAASGRTKKQTSKQLPIFVDTSVLIDGRIVAIAESGFVSRPLYIPRSVVGELQFLADNSDTEKRTRARHGLDVINQLQSIAAVDVVIFADGVRAEEGVDNRLLTLATEHSGALCTIDYNLNKVAVVQGIQVLNVNELAKTLRMAYLPGEKIRIELTQKGNDSHQGVGHLPDGTMVVVEKASKYIGTIVEVEFIRALQTAAGKMMFAKLVQTVKDTPKSAIKPSAVKEKPAGRKKVADKPQAQTPRSEQARTSQQKDTPRKDSAQKKAQATPRSRTQRRKSPEDSLVELANRR